MTITEKVRVLIEATTKGFGRMKTISKEFTNISDAVNDSFNRQSKSLNTNNQFLKTHTDFVDRNRSIQEKASRVSARAADISRKKQFGFFKVLGMGREEWSRFNKEGNKFSKRTGRMASGVRKATHGLKGFKMEMLGVMFFGMGLQRFFTGLLKPALEAVGVFDILRTVLELLFLPIAMMLLPAFLWLLDRIMNMSEGTKLWIGKLVILGIVLGSFLFLLGMFALGIGSVLLVVAPLIAGLLVAGSAVLTFFSNLFSGGGALGLIIKILSVFGLASMFVSAQTEESGEKQMSIWGRLKEFIGNVINSIKGFLSGLWNKLMEFEPVQKFIENLGLAEETLEKLKHPLQAIKNFVSGLWQKFILKNEGVRKIGEQLGLTEEELFNPLKSLGSIAEKVFGKVITKVKEMSVSLWTGISEDLPTKVADFIVKLIEELTKTDNLNRLIDAGVKIGTALMKGMGKTVWQIGVRIAKATGPAIRASGANARERFEGGGAINALAGNLNTPRAMADFISRPGQAPVPFSSDDTIIGTKGGSFGGGITINNNNTIMVSDKQEFERMLDDNNKKIVEDLQRMSKT